MFVIATQNSLVDSAAPCIRGGDSSPCSFIHCEYIFRASLQIINRIVWINPEFSLILYEIGFLLILFPACNLFFFLENFRKKIILYPHYSPICVLTIINSNAIHSKLTGPEFFYKFLKRYSRDVFLLV